MQFVALRRIHDPHPLNLRLPSSAQGPFFPGKQSPLFLSWPYWSLQSPAAANALGGLLDKSGLTTELSTPPLPISPHCPPLLSTSEDSLGTPTLPGELGGNGLYVLCVPSSL